MCFSATASFVAGGALTAIGAATIPLAKTKRELPLASIPLLFGAQQLVDGVSWLSFGAPAIHTVAAYAYSILAAVVWPIFVPLALLSIETNRARREVLGALALVGVGIGLFFSYYIVFSTVTARVVNNCVVYGTPDHFGFGILAFYLVATVGPFFVSGKKALNLLGVAVFISFSVAWWFYSETFTSTWCFFAAILSALLYWYFRSRSRV